MNKTDQLTGLLDRVSCREAISNQLAVSNQDLAVLWIDIDRFGQINATFGHAVGDTVLTEMAQRIERACPRNAQSCRVGGDEFVVALARTSKTEAQALAAHLLEDIKAPLQLDGRPFYLSASIGMALSRDSRDPHELLERAEQGKFQAKNAGGDQAIQLETQDLPFAGRRRFAQDELITENLLYEAMSNGGLSLQYQPVVDLDNGRPIGLEALLRCRTRNGVLSNRQYLPIAEKSGLIRHLGDWGMVNAITFAKQLHDEGHALSMSVNLSRPQLLLPSFFPMLAGIFTTIAIDPRQVEFEINESLYSASEPEVIHKLARLAELGCVLAIDDFASGNSSLSALLEIPIRKVKLSPAFVTRVNEDDRSASITRGVVAIARDLGITLVAKGVETVAQCDSLRDFGVRYIQGHLVARPQNEYDLIKWLKDRSRHGPSRP